jgi:hypothetical protein
VGRRRAATLLALLAALLAPASAHATLGAFQADRRIDPGTMPPDAQPVLVLVAPGNGFADGQISVVGAGGPVAWDPAAAPELVARTTFWTVARTSVGGKPVADPLPPLDPETPGQRVLFLRISTEGLAPGVYSSLLHVGVETIPVSLTVFAYSLPPRAKGFRTLFQIQPQTYFQRVDPADPLGAGERSNRALYQLLSDYRIAPAEWGYGTPGPKVVYKNGFDWYTRRGTLMRIEANMGFNTLRLPLSTQRQASGAWVGGVSPREPGSWRDWLTRVRPFWEQNGWLDRAVAWTWDEPGLKERFLLGAQARALHEVFPEAKLVSTISPGAGNVHLRDGGTDDLDIWAVLSRRFYGTYRDPWWRYRYIERLRTADKEIWTYTYHGVSGSPGYDATEPLTDPRLFFVWNAIEGTAGTLYADGMVTYHGRDPWRSLAGAGQSVFIYPGTPADPAPISSLRLEAIRDGIQDANLFEAYRARFGRSALVRLLARNRLFVARDGGLLLGCVRGCARWAPTKFAFPLWQKNERLASAGLERARTAALLALSR